MRIAIVSIASLVLAVSTTLAPPAAAERSPEDLLLDREAAVASAIRAHDQAALTRLLSAGYFYVVGQGQRLRMASRTTWLDLLRTYDVSALTLDDARVRVYGRTAIVTLLATEHAKISAVERTIQYFITDVWADEEGTWRLVERHASRPEPAPPVAAAAAR